MFSARILVVDDESNIRAFIERALADQGHQIVVAESGEDGLARYEQGPFDVVLTDVKMEGIDGIEMLRRIRDLDDTVVPVVMTALRDQETAVRALECGVQNFLIKPFSLSDLRDRVTHAIDARLRILGDLREREMLESQLFRAERLSLLGQMAPRIAHEFKTPLQLVSGNAELAKIWMDKNDLDQARKAIERILPATQQLLYMVQQMTNLGKPEESRTEAVNLAAELADLLDTLQPLGVIKYCTIVQQFEPDLPPVYGDPAQIEQVLRNLIVNAAQAMENTRKKEMTLQLKQVKGKQVQVVISDTGHGIPQSKLDDIFQPFFTTKTEGKGTGLGLAIVKSILKRHNATIHVESQEGEGTTFTLLFPVHTPKVPVEVLGEGVS